ncbi:HotDog domain-containing protein [Jackrogersella minutella]|nr:HotDog domain-containing protein [Jackrogersella minutella]
MTTTSYKDLNKLMEHFESVSWCANSLRAPGIIPIIPPARLDPQHLPEGALPSRDQLFRRLLDQEEGVPYILGFYEDPLIHSKSPKYSDLPFLAPSLSLLFDLRSGLSGFNGTAHGGFIGTMMDEMMGTLIFQNDLMNRAAKAKGLIPASAKDFMSLAYVTARMEISYRRPLVIPQIVVATATLERSEGRKTYIDVAIKDGDGKEYAAGRGTWISIPRPKL